MRHLIFLIATVFSSLLVNGQGRTLLGKDTISLSYRIDLKVDTAYSINDSTMHFVSGSKSWNVSLKGGASVVIAETDPVWSGVSSTYRTKVQNDLLYAALVHSHIIADVTGLQTALDAKGTLTNLTASANTGQTWVITYPYTTPNISLSLTIPAVTGLQTALDLKTESVADITALQAYTGTATTIIVKDATRGGVFHYKASGYVTDNGIVFPATGLGGGTKTWVRKMNGMVYHSNWFLDTATYKNAMFLAMFNALPNNATLVIDPSVQPYLFSTMVTILTNKNITVNAYGATLKKDSLTTYQLLQFQSTDTLAGVRNTNIYWNGGTFDGNRHYQYSSVSTIDTGNYLSVKKDTLPIEAGNRGLLTIRHYRNAFVRDVTINANAGEGIVIGETENGLFESCYGYDGLPISQNNDNNPLNTGALGYQNTYFKFRSESGGSCTWIHNRVYNGSIGYHYSSDHANNRSKAFFYDNIAENTMQDAVHVEHCKDVVMDNMYALGSLVANHWYYRVQIQIGGETQTFHSKGLYIQNGSVNFNNAQNMRENTIEDFYSICQDTTGAADYLFENPGNLTNGKIEGKWKTAVHSGDVLNSVQFVGRDTAQGIAVVSCNMVRNCKFDSLARVGSILGTTTSESYFTGNKIAGCVRGLEIDNSEKSYITGNSFKRIYGNAIVLTVDGVNVEISDNTFSDIALLHDASKQQDAIISGRTGTGAASPYVSITNNTFKKTLGSTATTRIIHEDNSNNKGLTINSNIFADTTVFSVNITNDAATEYSRLDISGYDSPESVLKASIGSTYKMLNGSGDSVLFIKTTALSKTGWVALARLSTVNGKLNSSDTAAMQANDLRNVVLNTPSVIYSTPINFSVSAHTATGTLSLNTQTANTVLAGPATGIAATPTMRSLVLADIPGSIPYSKLSLSGAILNSDLASGIDAAKITTGTLPTAQTAAETGDVTKSAGSSTTTIAAGTVTQAKTANYTAYTLWANNTSSSAVPANITYKYISEQTYAGTITWDGSPVPTGTTTHTYTWDQMGKRVTLRINLKYATGGTTNTTVTMALPADCPTPAWPTGFTTASDIVYPATGLVGTGTSSSGTITKASYLGLDGSGNPIITVVTNSALSAKVARVTVVYYIP